MTKLDRTIKISKFLTNLPYNKFNLDNYTDVLAQKLDYFGLIPTQENLPVQLMSRNHLKAGIIHTITKRKKRNIYIIGKGILFDSGGLDLKDQMYNMTNDKAGMIIALSVANYLKGNVVAYCPVTTNFIHTSKIIPGDEIKIGKKIVKISNTDAEGRLILAEALSTLNVTKEDIIITIATLTGCAELAVGTKATAYLTPSDDLSCKWAVASEKAKELTWRLPLWDYIEKNFYKKIIIKNAEKDIKADTIGAAVFLKQFVKYPNQWLHLDIASSAFSKDGNANGVPIKSLLNFIRRL